MFTSNRRFMTVGLILLLSILGLSQIALADPMLDIAGTTTGTFGSGTPSILTFGGTSGTPFHVITGSDGSASVTLGHFHLDNPDSGGLAGFAGDTFTLSVTFLLPSGISSPGSTHNFTAGLSGAINSGKDAESITIDFPDTPLLFTFNDGSHTGSFTFLVNDVIVPKQVDGTGHPSDGNATLTASIADADPTPAVPEPASLVLLGTAALGMGWIFRNRRRA
jgi:hypothetical protein